MIVPKLFRQGVKNITEEDCEKESNGSLVIAVAIVMAVLIWYFMTKGEEPNTSVPIVTEDIPQV